MNAYLLTAYVVDHEVMAKLTEWMTEQDADREARRRVRDEVRRGVLSFNRK